MKKHVVLLCTLTLVASLAACGGDEETTGTTSGTTGKATGPTCKEIYPTHDFQEVQLGESCKAFFTQLCACSVTQGTLTKGICKTAPYGYGCSGGFTVEEESCAAYLKDDYCARYASS